MEESGGWRYCPEDGYLLARYRVGHGTSFTIDRCRHCEGVWLDPEEWQVLKERGLHTDLEDIFTEEWQDGVEKGQRRERDNAHWRRLFGEADYDRINEVKAWIESHSQRFWLYEFLKSSESPRRGPAS